MDWSWLFFLMCPLMMIPMMYFMMKGNHGEKSEEVQSMNCNSHNWMILFCILPIALAAVFFLSKGISGSVSNYLPLLLVLICPLSHLILMPLMHKKKQDRHSSM